MKLLSSFLIISIFSLFKSEPRPFQNRDEADKVYSELVGGKWESLGKWQSGAEYHQEVIFEMDLSRNLFKVRT